MNELNAMASNKYHLLLRLSDHYAETLAEEAWWLISAFTLRASN